MGAQARVPRSPCEALSVLVRNVLARLWISVPLGEAEVDCKYVMLSLANTNQEIIRFDVSVEVEARMDILDSLNHLVGKHQHSLESELSTALFEEFLQAWTEHVHDHAVPLLVLAKEVDLWESNPVA